MILTYILIYPGLGDEGKRVLGEFSGTAHEESIDTADPEPTGEAGQVWEVLEQEGTAQGFLDDIQGILNGK